MHVPHSVFENDTQPVLWTPKNECQPTEAVPGTPEKIAVLADRLRHGQPLWHPDDPVAVGGSAGRGVPIQVVALSWLTGAVPVD